MRILPNSNGSDSFSEKSSETGALKTIASPKQFFKELIQKANSVSLTTIFSHYGIKADAFAYNKKITCPFKFHSNGQERTPSFQYYSETNTFYCHGCKRSRSSSDFVAFMEDISKAKAAYRILELYGSMATINDFENNQSTDYSERLEIMMDFSNFVRNFIHNNQNNLTALAFMDQVTLAFDKMHDKHDLDNIAIKELIIKLKNKVEKYQSCL